LSNKKNERLQAIAATEWKRLLAEHLAIYQDAINYYLFCFAACARGSQIDSLKTLESRVRGAWESYDYRQSANDEGFRASLWRRFPDQFPPGITFEAACESCIDPAVAQRILNLAIESLLTDLGGEGTIQQGGRSYLPYFCAPGTAANFPRSRQVLERNRAKDALPALLHSEVDPAGIHEDYEIHHFAKLDREHAPYTGEDLRQLLPEWLKHLVDEQFVTTTQQARWLDEIAAIPDDTSLPRYNGASAKGAEKSRLYAFLLFKLLPCSAERFSVLRDTFPEPKADRAKTAAKETEKPQLEDIREARLTALGEDPVLLARGARGHVFRSFTNLFTSTAPEAGPAWVEFDISAFKEALKTINQIEQKTAERLARLQEIQSHIDFYTSGKGQPADDDNPVTFYQDPRLPLIDELKRTLAETLDDEVSEGGYSLRGATIKGWGTLRDRYRKALVANPAITAEELITSVFVPFQKRTKNIGSPALFRLLAEPKFHPLWRQISSDETARWARQQWSHDLLFDTMKHDRLLADLEELKANLHIRLTPAHARHSRRPLMLSDLGGRSKVIHLHRGDKTKGSLVCSIYARAGDPPVWTEQRIELIYSAPRLLRDNLSGEENRSLHQPLMKGLGLTLPDPDLVAPTAKDLAVSLISSWAPQNGGLPERLLLNFPATLETEWIAKHLGMRDRWNGQFNGTRDELLHLHWPETWPAKIDDSKGWWHHPDIRRDGFCVAAYDLGIRAAAACVIYHIVSAADQIPSGKHKYARFIGTAGGCRWHAYPCRRSTLRLPGEDQVTVRRIHRNTRETQRLPELYGRNGRLATPSDVAEFHEATRHLLPYLSDWLQTELAGAPPRYFTAQNELLLRAARQIQSYLSAAHRAIGSPETATGHTHLDQLIARHEERRTEALAAHIGQVREHLHRLLECAANRIFPQPRAQWFVQAQPAVTVTGEDGVSAPFTPFRLVLQSGEKNARTQFRGQGGLGIERIELIENLRRRLLSWQREANRPAGATMKIGFGRHRGSIPEVAPVLLEKLDQLKAQRIKQSAHLILAHALNLTLQTPSPGRPGYVHGEYAAATALPSKRPTVDFLVIEDLHRYRTTQGRTRAENRRLMQWSHRALTDTLYQLAEPYGLPVLTANAGYSSRFCAVTSRPGFRAREIAFADTHLLERWLREEPGSAWQQLAAQMRILLEKYADNPRLRLVIPEDGGILFVPVIDPDQENRDDFRVEQADLNAAQNLALRAVASPACIGLLHKVRAIVTGGRIFPRAANAREKKAFDPKAEIRPEDHFSSEILGRKFSSFFARLPINGRLLPSAFDQATTTLLDGSVLKIVSGYALWATLKRQTIANIIDLNNRRLGALGLPDRLSLSISDDESLSEGADEADDIPM
jgi:hypothetical protein